MKILHYNDEEKDLHRYLAERGHENVILPAEADVFERVQLEPFDAAYVGLHPFGLQLIRLLHRKNPDCLIIIITSDRNARIAVEAMKMGAFDYLLSPLNFAEVERAVLMMRRDHQSQRERHRLEDQFADAQAPHDSSPGAIDEAPLRGRLSDIVRDIEIKVIRQTIKDNQGNLSQVASTLAISRTTLYSKMRTYGIEF